MSTIEIGRVVAVHGFQVKIELDGAHRSAVRAGLDGVDTHVRINAYVTFDLGAGEAVLGIITDLHSHETFEPSDDDLTLELVRPRRMATAQLLGTVRSRTDSTYQFDPGVNLLPTLDTPAVPAGQSVLRAVLEVAPVCNRPKAWGRTEPYDAPLALGPATSARERTVYGSLNDLFSRPMAVVGSTGSGKSCTIAHLIQCAIGLTNPADGRGASRPHFFLLDVNGEYGGAFSLGHVLQKQPNKLYINGREAALPIWLMNAHEVCQWLSAAEQTQQPALVNLWALAKGAETSGAGAARDVRSALGLCEQIRELLKDPKGWGKPGNIAQAWEALQAYASLSECDEAKNSIEAVLSTVQADKKYDKSLGAHQKQLEDALDIVQDELEKLLSASEFTIEQTADKPVYFPISTLDNPAHLESAAELAPGDRSIRQFLQGLRLRLNNRRSDRRWQCFYNYEQFGVVSLESWLHQLGIGKPNASRVTIIDCSMLAHDVLPFVCAVFGRVLLELREQASSDARFDDPWMIVLEEAHNYVRPRRTDEARGEYLSRDTFERISKEGRKFGLSLLVASQRPSDVSATVLSQCSNFITHRLQNPDDIEHFRRIVPSQSRRLIDQITILKAGEAIVLGSAFNVPARVQMSLPNPEPSSTSSTPFIGWRAESSGFDLEAALTTWGLREKGDQSPDVVDAVE